MKKTHIFVSLAVAGALTGSAFALDGPIAIQNDGTPLLSVNYNTGVSAGVSSQHTNSTNVRAAASGTLIGQGDITATNASTTVQSDPTANFDMDANDASSTASTTVSSISDIFSGNDLQGFALWLFSRDANLVNITTKDDRVSMTRKTPSKFLGFIPVSTDETVEVISWGDGLSQVTVDRPWWDFLSQTTINKDALSQDIQSRINTISSTEFGTVLSAQTKAQIMAEIDSAFSENQYNASTTNSATGSTTNQ